MGKGKIGPNAKQVAGREKKATTLAAKNAVINAANAKTEDEEWKKGSNVRGSARTEERNLQSDEAARRRKEKADLLAAEEEADDGIAVVKKSKLVKGKGGKKKKKSDLSLLEDSLMNAVVGKGKGKKGRSTTTVVKPTPKPLDPLLANTQMMIGSLSLDKNGDGNDDNGNSKNKSNDAMATTVAATGDVGRSANIIRGSIASSSGIDAAIRDTNPGASFSTNGNDGGSGGLGTSSSITTTTTNPIGTSGAALYRAFEERRLPEMKEERPGLRLTQYREKIRNEWGRSEENPRNGRETNTRRSRH